MHIFNKLKGTEGIVKAWEESLKSPAQVQRARILSFWKKHGTEATKEAFGVSKRTLFRWQSKAELGALAPRSTAPKNRRKRETPATVSDFIVAQRAEHRRIGKEKLQALLKARGYAYSISTVGRIIGDLKKQGRLNKFKRLSLQAKTGRLYEHNRQKTRKQRRPKGVQCLELDTVVRFIGGVKRYVVTAVDTKHRFAFAGAYTTHTSATASDLLKKYALVCPVAVAPVQTDNGSEFADRFASACKNLGLTQYHTYPHCPKMNGHVERFNRTISEDFLEPNKQLLRDDVPAFNRKLCDWLLWYNTVRPHASLGQIAPLCYITNQLTPRECQMWWTRTAC